VADVLAILERRAADEARLILARRRATGQLCTEISDSLSGEINGHYARLFKFFQARPALAHEPLYQRALLSHLPAILRQEPRFRRRIEKLPQKYLSAILAAEIGSSLVYHGDREADFEDAIRLHVERSFPSRPAARPRHH
jgi:glutamate dehydrogenase